MSLLEKVFSEIAAAERQRLFCAYNRKILINRSRAMPGKAENGARKMQTFLRSNLSKANKNGDSCSSSAKDRKFTYILAKDLADDCAVLTYADLWNKLYMPKI